jgi:hypothetical protein
MFRVLLRHYKPKIQFRVGKKKIPKVEAVTSEEQPEVYTKPSYLSFKRILTQEEIDLLNQGGENPKVHWKKVTPLTDIRST